VRQNKTLQFGQRNCQETFLCRPFSLWVQDCVLFVLSITSSIPELFTVPPVVSMCIFVSTDGIGFHIPDRDENAEYCLRLHIPSNSHSNLGRTSLSRPPLRPRRLFAIAIFTLSNRCKLPIPEPLSTLFAAKVTSARVSVSFFWVPIHTNKPIHFRKFGRHNGEYEFQVGSPRNEKCKLFRGAISKSKGCEPITWIGADVSILPDPAVLNGRGRAFHTEDLVLITDLLELSEQA
jgi:hypothetical protein